MRPQRECAEREKAEACEHDDGLQQAKCAARTRQAADDLGQWSLSLGGAPR
jgi:hypothetical protein